MVVGEFRAVITFGQVLVLELYIVACTVGEERALLVVQRPRLLDRAADIQKAACQTLARWHQAPRAYDDLIFDHRAVHDRAAHAHQDPAAEGTAVQHDFMADGHFIADQQWETFGIERPGMGDVQHAAILHAGTRADADAVHVATDDRQRPHRAILTNLYIPQNDRRTVDESPWSEHGGVLLEVSDGHDSASFQCR